MSNPGGIAADRLKALIVRIEALEVDKAEIAGDIKAVYAEAKAAGFNTKMIRTMIKLRKLEIAEREEVEHLRVLYKGALGMIEGPPPTPATRPAELGIAPSAPSTETKH